MASSDVAVHSDGGGGGGYANRCLEIGEFSVAATNRELVNLENAAVNIDNSTDVIIGPVTQFNVNGNVTIYQNKDGLPVGLKPQIDEKPEEPEKPAGEPTCRGDLKAQSPPDKPQKPEDTNLTRRRYTLKIYLAIAGLLFVLLTTLVVVLLTVLRHKPDKPVPASGNTSIHSDFGRINLFPKAVWNGRPAQSSVPMPTPVDLVVIKHTGGGTCSDFVGCAKKMQDLQSQDFNRDLPDVYCSFAVGGDGNVYEGRGWDAKPEYLDRAIDVVMLGNFVADEFTPAMANATRALLQYGVRIDKLTGDYRVINHNQTAVIMSPGKNVVREVVKWPHYDSTNYMGIPLMIAKHSHPARK